jgi:hypothetical protein
VALGVLLLAAGQPAARVDTIVAVASKPTAVTALHGVAVWSAFDATDDRYHRAAEQFRDTSPRGRSLGPVRRGSRHRCASPGHGDVFAVP